MAVAERTITVCDLDRGTVEATTHLVADLGGTRYELDLCDEHAAQLRSSLTPVGSGSRRGTGRTAATRTRGGRRAGARTSTAGGRTGRAAKATKAAGANKATGANKAAGRAATKSARTGRAAKSAAGTSGRASTRSANGSSATSQEAVRNWARENGVAVKSRGRIPAAVIAAYQEAHSS